MSLNRHSAVLLGAGASAEAGIPTTVAMTEQLVEGINSRVQMQPTISALHFVCGALFAYDAASGRNPFGGLDVERVFAAVELLAERDTLEVSPFVAAWHPAVDALDTRPQEIAGNFDRRFASALLQPDSFGSVSGMIESLIDSRTGGNANGHVYRELAAAMVRELRSLVATTPKDSDYLRPLIDASSGPGGLTVATLNYDLSIEGVAGAAGVPCSTGLEQWVSSGKWRWPGEGIRLLKLHGSIDWTWAKAEEQTGWLPQRIVVVSRDPEQERRPPALVFGQRGKLRADGPFLGLLAEFETLLVDANRLVVIGYSFRDAHVNEVIQRWINEDPQRTMVAIDPDWPEYHPPYASDQSFRRTLSRHLTPPRDNETEFEPRLEIRHERCSAALQRLAVEH